MDGCATHKIRTTGGADDIRVSRDLVRLALIGIATALAWTGLGAEKEPGDLLASDQRSPALGADQARPAA